MLRVPDWQKKQETILLEQHQCCVIISTNLDFVSEKVNMSVLKTIWTPPTRLRRSPTSRYCLGFAVVRHGQLVTLSDDRLTASYNSRQGPLAKKRQKILWIPKLCRWSYKVHQMSLKNHSFRQVFFMAYGPSTSRWTQLPFAASYALFGGVMGDGPLRSFDHCWEAQLETQLGMVQKDGEGAPKTWLSLSWFKRNMMIKWSTSSFWDMT